MNKKKKRDVGKRIIVVFPIEIVRKIDAYLEENPTANMSNLIRVAVSQYLGK